MVKKNDLTEQQSLALKQVRKRLKGILEPYHDDEYILRFLVARKFNLDASVSMLEKHIARFKENGYNTVLKDHQPAEITNYLCTTVLGFDKEGSVVRYIGRSDYIGLALSVSKSEALIECVYLMESDLRMLKEKGKGTKITYIVDFSSLSWKFFLCKQVTLHLISVLKLYEANYPETLKASYYVNAPPVVEYFITLLSKYLPQDIISKINVLNSNDVQSALTKIIDPAILPPCLGGTRIDSDGDKNCSSLFRVKPGTPVPTKYYVTVQAENLEQDPNAKKVTIKKKSQFILTFLVDAPGTLISWNFKTATNDIAMGVNFKPLGSNDTKQILPIHRVDCHKFVESGKVECEGIGTYELVFSNLYSMLTKKVLTYTTQITKPGGTEVDANKLNELPNIKETTVKDSFDNL